MFILVFSADQKSININHQGHKKFTQSTQISEIHCFEIVIIVLALCALWLKITFESSFGFVFFNDNVFKLILQETLKQRQIIQIYRYIDLKYISKAGEQLPV